MEWILLVAALLVLALLFLAQKPGLIKEQHALVLMEQGARVVDVRRPEEFAQKNVSGAMNIPLHEVRTRALDAFSDKSQPLLLHCAMGGRSALAVKTLKQLGYTRVYNLGSLSRAIRIADLAQTSKKTRAQLP